MDPKYNNVLKVLQKAQAQIPQLNARQPAALDFAKKVNQMVGQFRNMPVPPEIHAAIMQFDDTIGARPEVSGIRTQIQGNLWEERCPTPIPFKRSK